MTERRVGWALGFGIVASIVMVILGGCSILDGVAAIARCLTVVEGAAPDD